jgi:hypothetical protein
MISMVDFGEFQPFEDAEMIRPTIAIVEKASPGGDMHLFKWLTSGRPPETLSDVIAAAPTLNAAIFDLTSEEIVLLQKEVEH